MKIKPFLLTLCVPFFLACGEKNASASVDYEERASLQMALAYSESSRFDSLVLHGVGYDTVHIKLDSAEETLTLELFPALWKFEAKLYSDGFLMQEGEAETEIRSGVQNYLQIDLHALIGFLDISIPIGFGNPGKISKGTLSITSSDSLRTYSLKLDEPNAYFSTDALPLNKTYRIKIELFNEKGDCMYFAEDSVFLDKDNASLNWALSSLKGSLYLTIAQDSLSTISASATLPAGSTRLAEAGDLLITEILPIPEQTGSNYEFIEVYNGTLDTLLLDSCVIGSSSKTKTSILPENTKVPPASFFTIGADSAQTDAHPGKWTALVNTKSSLVIHCAGIVIDSLFYGQMDSTHTDYLAIAQGRSTQLKFESWRERASGSAWCLGTPTPGQTNACLSE